MKTKTLEIANRLQRGYLMVEMMAATAVLGIVVAFAMMMTRNNEVELKGAQDGENMAQFSEVAAQFLINNRSAIELAMTDGTAADQYCMQDVAADGTGGTQVNSVTKHTCGFDASLLIAKGLWPAALQTGTMDGKFMAIFRLIYDTQPTPVPTGGVEALFVIASPTGVLGVVTKDKDRTVAMVAGKNAIGGTGGIVPIGDMGSCAAVKASNTYEVCGTGWKAKLSDFINTAELTTFADSLPN